MSNNIPATASKITTPVYASRGGNLPDFSAKGFVKKPMFNPTYVMQKE